MATQGYQEYQGGYHTMTNGGHHAGYDQWNHHHSMPPHQEMPYHGYHQGYGNYHYGHYYDGGAVYNSYYPNHFYEMGNYDANSFLPSDCSDCVFISGLPKTIQKDEIISAFSQVGKIKVAKGAQRIFLFLDRKTKDPTGDATVTFQSPESAKKAIDQFDQTDFNGHGLISVKQASPDQKNPFAEMLRRQSEANSFPRGFGLRGNMSSGHARLMRNGRNRNNGRTGNGRQTRNQNRSTKHTGQTKSQPTLITQTRSTESSETPSKQNDDSADLTHNSSEILNEITAKTEEIKLTN